MVKIKIISKEKINERHVNYKYEVSGERGVGEIYNVEFTKNMDDNWMVDLKDCSYYREEIIFFENVMRGLSSHE